MQPSHIYNPYETLYRSQNIQISQFSTKQDAEHLNHQLFLLNNTFRIVTNDLKRLLQFKFQQNVHSKSYISQNLPQPQNPASKKSQKKYYSGRIGQKINAQNLAAKSKRVRASQKTHSSKKKRLRKVVQIILEDSQTDSNDEMRFKNRPKTRSQSKKSKDSVRFRCQKVNLQDIDLGTLRKVKKSLTKMQGNSVPQIRVSQNRIEQQSKADNLNKTILTTIVKAQSQSSESFKSLKQKYMQKTFDCQFKSQTTKINIQQVKKRTKDSFQQFFVKNEIKSKKKEPVSTFLTEETQVGKNREIYDFYLKKNQKQIIYEKLDDK